MELDLFSSKLVDRFESCLPCASLPPDEKDDLIHEFDAVAAHLYGLDERQLVHIFETFQEGWDCHDRREAVRRHFLAWR